MLLRSTLLRLIVLAVCLCAASVHAAEPSLPLHILYIGSNKTDRAVEFEQFLRNRFAKVTVANRDNFDPAVAKSADVVLLDWSQSDSPLDKTTLPLGRLADWNKPTVLLNHAGLLVAGHWQLIGGAG
jgi:hypothetical protein